MECVFCKNRTTKNSFVIVPIVRKDKIVFIRNIPAQIGNNSWINDFFVAGLRLIPKRVVINQDSI